MKNRKYRVCRDNVYVGEVVKTDRIYRYKGDRDTDFSRIKPGQLNIGSWVPYRSMLFVPDEKKLSNDLLYRSPSYPILNVTDDDTCLKVGEKGIIVIKDACNLAALLEYFGYGKELTFEDIMRIRKTFFNGRFAMDNCELFGWKEIQPEDWTYYQNDAKITDPEQLRIIIVKEKMLQKFGHRAFSGISGSVLPREYWDVLDERGDHSLLYAMQWHEKMDAFAPPKQEGPVKKLTRF